MMGASYDKLPDDVKQAVVEAGHEVIAKHYALAAENEAATRVALESEGVTITELSDIDTMRERMQPVVEAWIEKGPLIGEFVEKARASE